LAETELQRLERSGRPWHPHAIQQQLVHPSQELWPRLSGLRWLHSVFAGLEHLIFPELASSPTVMTNAKASALPRLTGVGGGACLPVAQYCARVDASLLLLHHYQALILRKSAHIPYIVATSCVTHMLERTRTGAEDFLLHSLKAYARMTKLLRA
jgi:hypothetical protein